MLKRLVQAAIITLLLNLILGLTDHTTNTDGAMTSKVQPPVNTPSEPIASLLVHSLK